MTRAEELIEQVLQEGAIYGTPKISQQTAWEDDPDRFATLKKVLRVVGS